MDSLIMSYHRFYVSLKYNMFFSTLLSILIKKQGHMFVTLLGNLPVSHMPAMQTGFGWSNGVVLAFLEEFGWPQDLKIDC